MNLDLIGWLATIIILISFTIKNNMYLLRVINTFGAVLWLVYATLKNELPLIGVNFSIIMIHFYWFIKNKDNENKK